jgi:hypothetical protein
MMRIALLSAVLLAPCVEGFSVHSSSLLKQSTTFSSSKSASALSAIDPQFLQDTLPHIHSAAATAASASHLWLADAAAVADAGADVVAADAGWWATYLNIFKELLALVHETIDEPLQNAGVTQTWGISIALFTAGTYRVIECGTKRMPERKTFSL